jgi:hypothetical protein
MRCFGVMKLAGVSIFIVAATAFAQDTTIPPEVVSVATVGRWQSGPTSGAYRIIVTRDGWEHVWSHVLLEWIPDPPSREIGYVRGTVVELIPPIGQGTAVLEASARLRKPGELAITVMATSNMEVQAKPQSFMFVATKPGIVSLVKSPGKQ